jgi:hypothetical protein
MLMDTIVRAVAFGSYSVWGLILGTTDSMRQNVPLKDLKFTLSIPAVSPGPRYYIHCKYQRDLSLNLRLLHLMLFGAVHTPVGDFNSDYFQLYKYVRCEIVLKDRRLTCSIISGVSSGHN